MARFVTGNTFGTTDTVTAAKLNTAVNDAAISTDSVDNNTIELNSNALRLKDSSSKTTGVTFAKMQHISTAQVLGRVSASEGDVEEVGVIIGGSGDAGLLFDNDDMLDNSDTAGGSATRGATQQSIKAYIDEYSLKYSGATANDLQVSGISTYRDLDLSSVVGSNRALVIMQVFGGSGSTNTYFRTKGTDVRPFGGSNVSGYGASGGVVGPAGTDGDGYTCVVITDENGVIEYTGGDASVTGISYRMQAYQKLR
jgi:membrane-bound inhibitor of C-type lysozyme